MEVRHTIHSMTLQKQQMFKHKPSGLQNCALSLAARCAPSSLWTEDELFLDLSSPVLSPSGGRKGFSNTHGSRKSVKDEKNFFPPLFLQGGSSHSTAARG